MKKFVSLFLFTLLFGGLVNAQSLSLEWDGTVVEDGTVITITGDDFEAEYISHMIVRNNSSEVIGVKVKKEHIAIVEGSMNSFCWGLCFGPDVMVSPSPINIDAGAASGNEDFSGHYYPLGFSGITTVKYTFFDERNEDNAVAFTVNYSIFSVSIGENANEPVFGNIYPNPANNMVSLDYNLKSQDALASVSIFNMLGQKLKSEVINNNEGILQISVSDLSEGVYFYSVILNNEVAVTNKFVVRR